jgi:uncharacterized protein (DUF2147 family)
MSKSQKAKPNVNPPAAPPTRRLPREAIIVLIVAAAAAGIYWWGKGQHNDTQAAATPTVAADPAAAATGTNQTAATATSPAAFEKLKGKWMRPDGGYVIEIKNVDPSGKMEAAYFNPQPITVSQAVAAQDGAVTKVFIELQGINYPGSTYTLIFDPGTDQLKGIYFQAKLKQQFEVYFERMAKP